jgi:hypothetical protein
MATLHHLVEWGWLTPWLSCVEIASLTSVDRWLQHESHALWEELLRKELGITKYNEPIKFPSIRGEQIAFSYMGSKNQWEPQETEGVLVSEKAFTAPLKRRPLSFWRRVMLYYFPTEPSLHDATWCFYRTPGDGVQCFENLFYYEVHLSPSNREDQCMSIGLALDSEMLKVTGWMVGWTSQSVGFHTDEKVIRRNNIIVSNHMMYAPETIRVVGCGWRKYSEFWMAFFTINGRLFCSHYLSWDRVPTPMLVYDTPFDFTTNFGDRPFLYSLKN